VSRLANEQARGALSDHLTERRALLAKLLDGPAEQVAIGHDEHGAPCLQDHPGIHVSFSRSGRWNALACSAASEVGVDIELVRDTGWKPMLEMICKPSEAGELRAAVDRAGTLVPFFRLWTIKEAVLKAAGSGLKGGAKRVGVPLCLMELDSSGKRIALDDRAYRVDVSSSDACVVARALRV